LKVRQNPPRTGFLPSRTDRCYSLRDMKSTLVAVFTLLLTFGLAGTAPAQIAETPFKAGAYRGVITVTTAVAGVGQSSATLKVNGRSEGNSSLRLIGTPQLAQPIVGQDDSPVRLFSLEYDTLNSQMRFSEVTNVDATASNGHLPLTSLTVKGASVRSTAADVRTFSGTTVDITVKIVLTRTGK
jgi:hypothetical protein